MVILPHLNNIEMLSTHIQNACTNDEKVCFLNNTADYLTRGARFTLTLVKHIIWYTVTNIVENVLFDIKF